MDFKRRLKNGFKSNNNSIKYSSCFSNRSSHSNWLCAYFRSKTPKTELEKKNILLNAEIEKTHAPNQTGLIPEVYNLIASWCRETGVKQVAAKIKTESDGTKTLVVYSDRPGYLIGKAGCIIDKYAKAIKSLKIVNIKRVVIEEIYGIVNQFHIDVDNYYNTFMASWFAYEEAGEEC